MVGDHIADVIIYVVVALIALALRHSPMWHVLMIPLTDEPSGYGLLRDLGGSGLEIF